MCQGWAAGGAAAGRQATADGRSWAGADHELLLHLPSRTVDPQQRGLAELADLGGEGGDDALQQPRALHRVWQRCKRAQGASEWREGRGQIEMRRRHSGGSGGAGKREVQGIALIASWSLMATSAFLAAVLLLQETRARFGTVNGSTAAHGGRQALDATCCGADGPPGQKPCMAV